MCVPDEIRDEEIFVLQAVVAPHLPFPGDADGNTRSASIIPEKRFGWEGSGALSH
jgi:hypothetical protein